MNKHLSMIDVIHNAATPTQSCPFCGEDAPNAEQRAGLYLVGCENDDCMVRPQASGKTLAEAWSRWNGRAR